MNVRRLIYCEKRQGLLEDLPKELIDPLDKNTALMQRRYVIKSYNLYIDTLSKAPIPFLLYAMVRNGRTTTTIASVEDTEDNSGEDEDDKDDSCMV